MAEDDVLLREGLASLLERSGFEVVGQAGDAARLLALVRDTKPELAVVDIRMPPTHTTEGLDAARQIRQQHPQVGCGATAGWIPVAASSSGMVRAKAANVPDRARSAAADAMGGDPALRVPPGITSSPAT